MVTAESNTIITLTDEEWAMVEKVGTRRHREAEKRGYRQGDGHEWDNALANHIQGAGGESAAAKFYEIRWDATINGFKEIPDLLCL